MAVQRQAGQLVGASPSREKSATTPTGTRCCSATGREKVYLFFKVGKKITEWETWWTTSSDDGTTWSKPVELVKGDRGGRGPVRNKPIVLSNGVWLAGASFESETGDKHWDVFVDRSSNNGRTWKATPFLELGPQQFQGTRGHPAHALGIGAGNRPHARTQ